MNKQNNRESEDQTSQIEDLAFAEDRQAEIKGGSLGDGSVRPVKDSISSGEWR